MELYWSLGVGLSYKYLHFLVKKKFFLKFIFYLLIIMRIIRSEMIITNYIYYIKLFHIHHGDIRAYEFNMK